MLLPRRLLRLVLRQLAARSFCVRIGRRPFTGLAMSSFPRHDVGGFQSLPRSRRLRPRAAQSFLADANTPACCRLPSSKSRVSARKNPLTGVRGCPPVRGRAERASRKPKRSLARSVLDSPTKLVRCNLPTCIKFNSGDQRSRRLAEVRGRQWGCSAPRASLQPHLDAPRHWSSPPSCTFAAWAFSAHWAVVGLRDEVGVLDPARQVLRNPKVLVHA